MSTDLEQAARRGWELREYRRLDELAREHPVAHDERWSKTRGELIDYGAPKVRLLCKRGHRLVTVQSDASQHPGALYPVRSSTGDGRPESGRPVVFDAFWMPEAQSRAKGRCLVNGCPKITRGTYCEDHAQRPDDLTHDEGAYTIRVRLKCPRKGCKYDNVRLMSDLYMFYVAAVGQGWHELRLPE